MSQEDLKAFENWLVEMWRVNNTIPFHVVASALKAVRANAR